MDDERTAPQNEDDDEVEAHLKRQGPAEDVGRNAPDEDDDEVEAHARRWGPAETKAHDPAE